MRARPVIGGLFIKMLEDRATWKKWSGRDQYRPGAYAPAPIPPKVTELVPASRKRSFPWRFTTTRPAHDWTQPGFDDRRWRQGPAGFGTDGTPGIKVATTWHTADIWIRREITLPPSTDPAGFQLLLYHDEDAEVYIDGILAAREAGYVTEYQPVEIGEAARAHLKPGAKIVLAVHCLQTRGGQGIDVGLVEVSEVRSGRSQ
jgi:hypothetical protein